MPNKNGTGPLGEGPRSGRGAGRCGRGQRTTNRPAMGRQGMMQQGFRRLDNNEDTELRDEITDLKKQLASMSKALEELTRQPR